MQGNKNVFYVLLGVLLVAAVGFMLWSNMDPITTETKEEKKPVVATTTTKTTTTKQTTSKSTKPQTPVSQSQTVPEKGVTIVTFTGKAFVPEIVEIKLGEEVRFVNKSGGSMRIAANEFLKVPSYGPLNQSTTVGVNGIYQIPFTTAGTWGYHNLNSNPTVGGIINVK